MTRAPQISPFAADQARKSRPKAEFSESAPNPGPRLVAGASPTPSVVMGAAAPAAVIEEPPKPAVAATPLPEPLPEPSVPQAAEVNIDVVRTAVLEALGNSGQRMLVSMLEIGEWNLEGIDLTIKVAASATIIDMSLGAESKRLIIAKASEVVGRTVRLKIVPGAVPSPAAVTRAATSSNGGRGRAEQDPIVRRMKEKFGAEIRTIIDYKEKR